MVMAKIDPKNPPKLPPRPLPTPPGGDDKPGGLHPHPHPHPLPPIPIHPKPKDKTFDEKDANHDGKLNADEFNDGRGLIDKIKDPKKFDRYDTDNDGYVTKKENAIGHLRDAFKDLKKSKVDLPDWKEKVQLKDAAPAKEAAKEGDA